MSAIPTAAGLALAAFALAYSLASTTSSPAAEEPASFVPPRGHLILQVEGDANALAITRITPKTALLGPHRATSDYQVVVRSADGGQIATYPLDLSAFDLDPAHVGNPIRVEGCVVIDTRVAMVTSIPYHPDAAGLELTHGQRVLGRLGEFALGNMIEAGGQGR